MEDPKHDNHVAVDAILKGVSGVQHVQQQFTIDTGSIDGSAYERLLIQDLRFFNELLSDFRSKIRVVTVKKGCKTV